MTSDFREEFNRNIGDWILAHPGENPSEEQWRYLSNFAVSLISTRYSYAPAEDIAQKVCISLGKAFQEGENKEPRRKQRGIEFAVRT